MEKQPDTITHCPNCETEYAADQAAYCHNCGQSRRDIRSPIWFWIGSFFESFFNYDSRLWRTLRLLFTKPGKLSADFNMGRRARYIEPFRLYLIVSVAFFLAQGAISNSSDAPKDISEMPQEVMGDTSRVHVSFMSTSFPTSIPELRRVLTFDESQLDSFLLAKELRANKITRMLLRGTAKLITGDDSLKQFEQSLVGNISRAMFFLMPFFAFLLWLFFKNRAPYYLSHLVFALHFHAAAFIIFLAYLLPILVFGDYSHLWIPLLLCIIYLFISLRTAYAESKIITGIKLFSASVVYLTMIGIAVLLAAIVSIVSF